MAKADQIKALIRCHAEGDDTRFYAVAMQVAAQAARSGHGNLAQELRELVDKAKAQSKAAESSRSARPVPLAQPRGELAGLLTVGYPKTRLADMALGEGLADRLDRVIREQRQRERLRSHGFSPLRKLLLIGPSGTGKTMTASALAGELGLPLFTIQLDGLITKFMGETAAKLRLVFEAIAETRGVYLFDEFVACSTPSSSSWSSTIRTAWSSARRTTSASSTKRSSDGSTRCSSTSCPRGTSPSRRCRLGSRCSRPPGSTGKQRPQAGTGSATRS